ncbi:MAG: HD domain-containing protein [Candidatus Omnitrophica bacterium]|nr:HD domain-containing protein [Candidatus Omnitrophota bacterium]
MSTKNSLSHTKKYKIVLSINHMVYRLINSTYNLKELTLRLAKFICQVLNSGYCSVTLLEPNTKTVKLKAVVGPKMKDISSKKAKLKKGLEKKIIDTSDAYMNDSVLGVPLIGEDTFGSIVVKRNGRRGKYESFDQELLTAIAEQAVIAIKNLQLYDEQQKIVYGSIRSLVTILDKKVPSLSTHLTKYASIVVEMAKELHLSESQIMSLKHASLLHDAGKVDIPLEILTKRSKLTSEEYGIIKSHPEKGAEIIKPLEALKPVIPIILYHHEKYDGSGYPSGLKKDEIPVEARIMAVADAFEAMISSRPYKTKKTIFEAIGEIKGNSGTQFDPRVVEAFLRLSKKRKFKKYLSFYH